MKTMNKLKTIFIFLVLLLNLSFLYSQKQTDLKINELFINNIDNLADEYGRHVPWVEIFNTSYNSVNIAECYLTNDTTGLAAGNTSNWYRIPKGDPKTIIPQRSFLIFYLDNTPSYGVFHTNFNPLDSNSNNYIALIGSNGKTIIDIFKYDNSLRTATHSYGYRDDFGAEEVEVEGKMVKNLSELKYFTPGSNNNPDPKISKSEELRIKDKYGIGMTIIAMSVVFFSLFVIFIILKIFGRLTNKQAPRLKLRSAQKKQKDEVPVKVENESTELVENAEALAAVSMALHYYLNSAHDPESEVITIETPSAHFSPWSQKHLMVKRTPKRR